MSLEAKRERTMASRAVRPGNASKLSKDAAARQIASLLETHMTEASLSEREKNQRVEKFGKRVDQAIRRNAKGS
jgi:hypothetical protein